MTFERKPILDRKGQEVDFESKRLKFWLENVPEDIRRLEYELWKRYRVIHHARLFQFEQKKKAGRFTIVPPYPEGQQQVDWKDFSESFLVGDERKERSQDIVNQTQIDISQIIETGLPSQADKILLAVLSGSSVYGPRKSEEQLSDIDIHFLFDTPTGEHNTEIFPGKLSGFSQPYHIIGTGYSDEAREQRSQIHWLLYPTNPIINNLEDARLKEIISDLVEHTKARKEAIQNEIIRLDGRIEEFKEERIID